MYIYICMLVVVRNSAPRNIKSSRGLPGAAMDSQLLLCETRMRVYMCHDVFLLFIHYIDHDEIHAD